MSSLSITLARTCLASSVSRQPGLAASSSVLQRLLLQHRAGEVVIAQVEGLVDHADVDVGLEDLQLNRRGQARRAGAHDQDRHLAVFAVVRHAILPQV